MRQLSGFAVHIFTGLGAVCALLATEALMAGAWTRMFFWLGVAFLIDGADGPIARAVKVKNTLPRFSGEIIDLVIDYLTYVFVPALALLAANRLPDGLAYVLTAGMLLSSLFHFSDEGSKAGDLAFVGFPAVWNIVAFYIFVTGIGATAAAVLIVVCIALTFVPMHWVHPVRVTAARPLTLVMTAAWAIAAAWSLRSGFPAPVPVQIVLVAVGAYGVGVSLWLSRSTTR